MRLSSRTVVLAAAIALPLGAALASYALAGDPRAPSVPPVVRIGEDNPAPPATTTTPPPPATTTKPPATTVVPPPPVGGDDDDDGPDDGPDDDD
jgi:hypothetical protein